MAWTTIASTDTDVDSPITVSLMTGIVGNFDALATGATGAPKIEEAAMDAASVNQAALKSTVGSVSTSSTGVYTTLPGGDYGFWPTVKSSATTSELYLVQPMSPDNTNPNGLGGFDSISVAITTSYVNRIILGVNNGPTIYAQQRYITASPPNWINKADGEIPLFLYAQINKSTSDIISIYCADAAPWHYNGPTDIRPSKIVRDEDGSYTKYRARKDMRDFPFTLEQAKTDPVKLQEYDAAFAAAPVIHVEITQDTKNADMPLIPRPFEPDADSEVILLNPVGDLTWSLSEMTQHEQFDINELLHEGRFKIQNTAMNISTPPGVQAFDFSWK